MHTPILNKKEKKRKDNKHNLLHTNQKLSNGHHLQEYLHVNELKRKR